MERDGGREGLSKINLLDRRVTLICYKPRRSHLHSPDVALVPLKPGTECYVLLSHGKIDVAVQRQGRHAVADRYPLTPDPGHQIVGTVMIAVIDGEWNGVDKLADFPLEIGQVGDDPSG